MDLEWKSVKELKGMCQSRGLDCSGTKADLIARLTVIKKRPAPHRHGEIITTQHPGFYQSLRPAKK